MFFKSTPWRFFLLAILMAPSIPRVLASEKDDFLESVRKAHVVLEQKCLQNIRVEETVEIYKDGLTTPGRSLTFLGVSDSYLSKTSELSKDEKGFHERVVVTRPDGRYVLAKRPNGPYVLGGILSTKPPIEGLDLSFMLMFPFYSSWTGGKVTDLLSSKTTSFKVVRKEAGGIEIEIIKKNEEPKSPFNLSPMQIILDDQTYALKSVRGRQTLSGRFIAIEADYTDGFPTTITVQGGPDQATITANRVHKFPVYRTEAISKSEFSLGQFGIPEPNKDFQQPWYGGSRPIWFLGSGLLVVVLCLLIRRKLNPR